MVQMRTSWVNRPLPMFSRAYWKNSTLPSRLLFMTGMAISMIPATDLPIVLIWVGSFLSFCGLEYLVFRERAFRNQSANHLGGDLRMRYVLGLIIALHAVVAITLMWLSGLIAVQVSAVVICLLCMVNLLLQTYNHPRLFLFFVAPYCAVIALGVAQMTAASIRDHAPWRSIPVLASGWFLFYYLRLARRQLAAADLALRDAEQRALERGQAAERASEAKSEFLAAMSHEIRTPLNGVLGMAQALEQDPLTPGQHDRVTVVRESAQSLLVILNDILDLSKIEAKRLTLEQVPFNLSELVESALSPFRAIADAKGVAFPVSVAPDAVGRYQGDPTRLRQILHNMISNGLKFTQAGEVSVRVEFVDGLLSMAVSDTGIGLEADRIETLFEKFVQADSSTTRKFGGTGLGLSICRELCQLMGGDIGAVSTPGRGATFTATVRIARLGAEMLAASSALAARDLCEDLDREAVRILAAEDNATNRLVLTTLLGQAGVAPTLVENGREAVEAWEKGDWDVILMDIQMPEMDGVTATRLIRAREAETGRARTPILALTANALPHQIESYRAEGMDGSIAKPIIVGDLFAALDKALARPPEDAVLTPFPSAVASSR